MIATWRGQIAMCVFMSRHRDPDAEAHQSAKILPRDSIGPPGFGAPTDARALYAGGGPANKTGSWLYEQLRDKRVVGKQSGRMQRNIICDADLRI